MNTENIYYIGENNLFDLNTTTIEDCVKYLQNKKVISVDIETTRKFNGKYGKREGLDPYLSKIVMFQIGDLERQYVIDYRCISINPLKEILESNSIVKVGHNIKFEYKHILHNNGIKLNNVYDTMIVEQILFNGYSPKLGLKDLNEKYLNIVVNKETRLEFLDIKDKYFTERQIIYGAEDILYPLRIKEFQDADIIKKELSKCVSLEMLFLQTLGDIEYKGINFNKDIWEETYNKNKKRYSKLLIDLNNYVLENFDDTIFVNKQLDLFADGLKCAINWGSSKQVITFFKYLGICPQEVSKSTKILSYTVNAKVVKASLKTINSNIKDVYRNLLDIYLEYKELEQSCTTFGVAFFKYINPITNRLHSNYKQILNTGRISSSNPNLQNIPSNNDFRRAFDSPDGYRIVNADYSGQENICLANTSMDPDILNFYYKGHSDMHSYNAQKIYPALRELSLSEIKEKHPEKRQIAKSVSFALAYGGNGFTISNNLGISPEEGEAIYNAYFNAFPKLKLFFDESIKKSMDKGFIEIDPITKRKFYFGNLDKLKEYKKEKNWRKYCSLKGKYERACLNYIIQGAAGSITKLAAIYYRKWLNDNKLNKVISITNLIHDEINLEVKNGYTEIAARNLEDCMQRAGAIWCKTIPLKADAVVTSYWTH